MITKALRRLVNHEQGFVTFVRVVADPRRCFVAQVLRLGAGVEWPAMTRLFRAAALVWLVLESSSGVEAQRVAEASNVELVGHNDLNGRGDGGEGLALQQWPDGRRLLLPRPRGASAVPQHLPRRPREVGRWWLPGTRKGDRCLPGCLPPRHAPFDNGYRSHQVEIWPDHADRAYVAYIDGGAMIFDMSGLAQVKAGRARTFSPRLISRVQFHPPYPAWTHTFQPMFGRKLAWASDEDVQDNCKDAPKLVWLLDLAAETNPVIIGTAPLHENDGELCTRGGRFGAHNLHPNFPGPLYTRLENTTVASWFNGGVRLFRPPGNPSGTIQINHAIVDEQGLIYANDASPAGSTS